MKIPKILCISMLLFVLPQAVFAEIIFIDDFVGFSNEISDQQTFTIDFESGNLPTFNDPNSSQSVNINALNNIRGNGFGTAPASGALQGGVNRNDNSTRIITFTFSEEVNSFGLSIGDMFDAPGTFRLTTNTGITFLDATAFFPNGGTGQVTDTITGSTFTGGNGLHVFFGVTDSNPFNSVTLTHIDAPGNAADNFVIDDVVVGTAVPEPSTYILLFVLAVGAWFYKNKKAVYAKESTN
ncbi:PEP-CTERM sorting domain-containing protein [Candidatus Uabimicrobium amorphum]|uniref:PEP-CTERM protein-sorting domain-containing protein n=1 Tax=Uabimicrobium amorphum TaxID=2596890 RepID=A0A5S9F339_UABAM|nr:PEP-CTERM sorting domain-containing protein [Candidatus Uabimicrobium amorphum]BBM83014.1 hypothetical protein UABAM_01357 [Candidatus Uabimicrobium amorphum]